MCQRRQEILIICFYQAKFRNELEMHNAENYSINIPVWKQSCENEISTCNVKYLLFSKFVEKNYMNHYRSKYFVY